MDTFTATSYSMGRPRGRVTFQAHSPESALRHPKLSSLPIAGSNQAGGKVRVVGIKRHARP